jgi:hypothetical protein
MVTQELEQILNNIRRMKQQVSYTQKVEQILTL